MVLLRMAKTMSQQSTSITPAAIHLMYDGGLSVSHHTPTFIFKGQVSSHIVDALYDIDQKMVQRKRVAMCSKQRSKALFRKRFAFEEQRGWLVPVAIRCFCISASDR